MFQIGAWFSDLDFSYFEERKSKDTFVLCMYMCCQRLDKFECFDEQTKFFNSNLLIFEACTCIECQYVMEERNRWSTLVLLNTVL
jgi:hypothetical protein